MLFNLIVTFVVVSFLSEVFLEYLNSTMRSAELPDELRDIYPEDKYRQSINYEKTKQRFSLFRGFFSLLLILAMLIFGGFSAVDEIARSITDSPVLVSLIFFGIIMFASDIAGLPFDWYGTFVIEEKFGFNKSTPSIFIVDKLKGWLIGIIIGGGGAGNNYLVLLPDNRFVLDLYTYIGNGVHDIHEFVLFKPYSSSV